MTIDANPSKFLDTEIMFEHGIIETSVVTESKLPNHWPSAVPKEYEQNVILED